LTTLKSVTTKLPENVLSMWKEHCKKQKKTSYELLQELVASELGIDLKKGWVIKPLQERDKA